MRPTTTPVEGVTAAPLALTSAQGWGEMTPGNEMFAFDATTDIPGPVAIATAAERTAALATARPGDSAGRAGEAAKVADGSLARPGAGEGRAGDVQPRGGGRLVAIGDSDFVVNAQLGNIGNRDFLQGAVQWLAAQESLIGIGPKTLETLKLSLTAAQLSGLRLLLLLVFPGLFVAGGAAVWWRRRA
jgi:ABC-type uncharacterized transport system involved in gliding motility auxiliary subunit